MDTLQLVDDERVRVYTLKRGINDIRFSTTRSRFSRASLSSPRSFPDWKGLRGDPSDTIKGVERHRRKTATELITNFGTIEKRRNA